MSDGLKEQSIELKVGDDDIAVGAAQAGFEGVEVESLHHQSYNSAVYKGTIRASGKQVAIKVTLEPVADDVYDKYAKILKVLKTPPHHGIAAVHSFGRLPDGKMFVVTEWIEWDSLRLSTAMKGQVENRVASMIISEICDALEAAHTVGIAHGCLRPENVFVKVDGKDVQVRIVDFGAHLVQPLEDHQDKVTDVYLSPEVRLSKIADSRSDLFSLAAIVFNMAMGEHLPVITNEAVYLKYVVADPLGLLSAEETMYNALKATPESVRKIPTTHVKALDELVQRCLQPNPDLRPQSAVEFKHTIQHAIFSKAPIGTGLQRASNPRSQRWIPITAGVMALCMLVGLFVVMYITEANAPSRPPSLAEDELQQLAKDQLAERGVQGEESRVFSFPYALLAKNTLWVKGRPEINVRRSLDGRRVQKNDAYTGRPLMGAFGEIKGNEYLQGGQVELTADPGRDFEAVSTRIDATAPFPVPNLIVPPYPTFTALSPSMEKETIIPIVPGRANLEFSPGPHQIYQLKDFPKPLRKLDLAPGDYIIDSLPLCRLELAGAGQKGPIRFFLSDDGEHESIDLKSSTFNKIAPEDVQFWYGGKVTIKIEGVLRGVIYAPNAKVVLAKGSVLTGAVIANDIEVEGDTTIYYDPQLLQKRDWSDVAAGSGPSALGTQK